MVNSIYFPEEPTMPVEAQITESSGFHHHKPNSLDQQSYMHELIKSDRNKLMMSDKAIMMRQIEATHAPDGREINYDALISRVENIILLATMNIDPLSEEDTEKQLIGSEEVEDSDEEEDSKEKIQDHSFSSMHNIFLKIYEISNEISYKTLDGTDGHAIALSVCNMLSEYQWEAKLLLSMAAFSFKYRELSLLYELHRTKPLANLLGIFKQFPSFMGHLELVKPRFKDFQNLVDPMMDVTRNIVDFALLRKSISVEYEAMFTIEKQIPNAVYWTIRSVVACETEFKRLATMGLEYISTTKTYHLLSLTNKLSTINLNFKQQLDDLREYMEQEKEIEDCKELSNLFMNGRSDNIKVITALLSSQRLYDGHRKEKVDISVLRGKNVLLLISSLKISEEELSIIKKIYNEPTKVNAKKVEKPFEIVWIPYVDPRTKWTADEVQSFKKLRLSMPWFTVNTSKTMERKVLTYIKVVWHFRKKTMLVVLDSLGRIVSPNAIYMMWIWGSTAFPFTSMREEALWKDVNWNLELLVHDIDPTILKWIKEDKYIFLYGGDDIEWARRFTKEAKNVAEAALVSLEMVYVGKSTYRERVRKAISAIMTERLSDCWDDFTKIWFFWIRLESMLFSKMHLGTDDEHDPIMREIEKLLSYEKEGGWAILAKGSRLVVNGYSTNVLETLLEYNAWKENIKERGFDHAFKDHYDKLYKNYPCSRFELSTDEHNGSIPETMKCPECLRYMDRFITFLCCHDEPITNFYNPINDLQ